MNNFFNRQSSRTYFLFGILTFILAEVVFGLAWDGHQDRKYLILFSLLAICVGATNNYFYFKNLINGNPKLKGGIIGGLTAITVALSFLFSIGMLLL
jgi:hypothetical protein